MTATVTHLTIEQGATFSAPISGGGAGSLRAKMRRRSDGAFLGEFTCSGTGASGTISLTAAQTALLFPPPWVKVDERECLLAYYDVEEVLGDVVTRRQEGNVYLRQEMTR
jgi:hypothetical protein